MGKKFGKVREAVQLYTKLFSDAAINGMLLYGEDEGSEVAGTVKHAQFTLDGKVFMAMDGFGPHQFDFNEGISIVVECKDQDEIDFFWQGLTANGGEESRCGWLKDPYGVSWQIIPARLGELMAGEKGQRAMQALLKMKKLDIAALENA